MKPDFTNSELYLIETIVTIDGKGNHDPEVIEEIKSILGKLKAWREYNAGLNNAFRILLTPAKDGMKEGE